MENIICVKTKTPEEIAKENEEFEKMLKEVRVCKGPSEVCTADSATPDGYADSQKDLVRNRTQKKPPGQNARIIDKRRR